MVKLMFGTVWESNPDKGTVRVEFAEDAITSAPLPYIAPGTGGTTTTIYPLPVGQQVACIMDGHCEYGVVLGPIYSEDQAPDGGALDKYRIKFSDGAVIEYDTTEHRLKATVGTSDFEVSEDGFTIKRGAVSLFDVLNDLLTAMQAETHPSSTGPTGPPVNIADYVLAQNKLPEIFEG